MAEWNKEEAIRIAGKPDELYEHDDYPLWTLGVGDINKIVEEAKKEGRGELIRELGECPGHCVSAEAHKQGDLESLLPDFAWKNLPESGEGILIYLDRYWWQELLKELE